jgi:hypothetical protein
MSCPSYRPPLANFPKLFLFIELSWTTWGAWHESDREALGWLTGFFPDPRPLTE